MNYEPRLIAPGGELPQVREVRRRVFIEEQGIPAELEFDGQDESSWNVLVQDEEGRGIGTGRLTPEGKIGRMAVIREYRGRGIGSLILEKLVEQARRLGREEAYLHAQSAAVAFYAKRGFGARGEIFQEAGIPHQEMRLSLNTKSGLAGSH